MSQKLTISARDKLAADILIAVHRTGLKNRQIAEYAHIDGPMLSRFCMGEFRTKTIKLENLCKFLQLDLGSYMGAEPASSGLARRLSAMEKSRDPRFKRLVKLLSKTWDGTPDHATYLQKVLRLAEPR